MKIEHPESWTRWVESLPRFAAANEKAEEEFLAGLSTEKGLQIFEELCRQDFQDKENRRIPGFP